jgi:hypothetical protein
MMFGSSLPPVVEEKTKQKHNTTQYVLDTTNRKQTLNKTWAILQTTGGKEALVLIKITLFTN